MPVERTCAAQWCPRKRKLLGCTERVTSVFLSALQSASALNASSSAEARFSSNWLCGPGDIVDCGVPCLWNYLLVVERGLQEIKSPQRNGNCMRKSCVFGMVIIHVGILSLESRLCVPCLCPCHPGERLRLRSDLSDLAWPSSDCCKHLRSGNICVFFLLK